jgi:hypothetical protein
MDGGSTGNSRRKSYKTKFKLEAVEVAKEKGNREAGRLFNVGESSVREWRKAETVLNVLHNNKRAMWFGRCLWPTIEKNCVNGLLMKQRKV